jgi:hypothetical protein
MSIFHSAGVRLLTLSAVGFFAQQMAFADASYQETTQMTGGSLLKMMKAVSIFSSKAREADKPIVSTVLVHGNKMAHISPTSTEIIDLDAQTITNIDNEKKHYSVMTFQQMKEAMQRAQEKAREAKHEKSSDTQQPNAQVSFNAHVTSTGAVKQIDGRDAKEALLTLSMDAQSTDGSNAKGSMAITNEMWLIPDAPGYEEVRQFNMKMAQLLAANMDMGAFAALLNTQPGANEALANLKKEAAQMKGIPVYQTMLMGMTTYGKPLPPPSASPNPNRDSANSEASAKSSSTSEKLGNLGKMMGHSRFGGLMSRKKSEDTKEQAPAAQNNQQQPTSAILLESTTHMTNFSADPVDASKFEVPVGYKQVKPRNVD